MKPITLLLADDHQVFRDGLKLLISRHPDLTVIGEAADGQEVIQLALALQPQVVIMDLSMPRLNGLQACTAIKQQLPRCKVVVLTMHEDVSYFQHLCGAQVDGYIVKRSAGEALIQAIHQVVSGNKCFDQDLAGQLLVHQHRHAPTKRIVSSPELSHREAQILRDTAWGYSNKEIAAELDLSVKTVETYKQRISEKLGTSSRTAMIRYAVREGWMNEVPPLTDPSPLKLVE
jgi:DNA-binding NarL/FixJ family response regulator